MADANQALEINREIGCILAVCGIFEGGTPSPPDPVIRKLEEAGLVPKKAEIRVVFEAAIRRTSDETAFFLDTRHFSVREFLDEGRGERAFVATLTLTTPGATADGDAIAIGSIDLGRRKRGADLIPRGHPKDAYPRFRSNLMPWRQMSDASKAVYDADVTAKQAAGKQYMPVTFTLTMSETDDGNTLLLALGQLLEGAKGDAATALSKLVLPEEREKTAAARAEAAEKLYEEELQAELELRQAQKKFDEGTAAEKPILAVELEQARRKLARKTALRRAAGLPDRDPVPFPSPSTAVGQGRGRRRATQRPGGV